MAYVVTEACRGEKYTQCVDVCPVDAFREGPDMLFIDPQVCIDCNACLTECPVRAIYPDSAVPSEMQSYIELNAEKAREYPAITESRDEGSDAGPPAVASTSPESATESPRRFAVVGSGPSGFYATDELLKQVPDARVDIFERLPTPFGLVRYGVAPDHPGIKSVTAGFEKTARQPGVRFFGNVSVGTDITRDDLLAHYDAVLYATGGSASRPLNLPGSDLGNILGAAPFVGWYNGHPDYRDLSLDLSGETAMIIGIGNVALDIARILTLPADELARTDIADYALEALGQSKIREVCLIARRGPVQAAFTPKELRQLLARSDLDFDIAPHALELDEASRAELADPLNTQARENMELLREAQEREPRGGKVIRFAFRTSPTAFTGSDDRVAFVEAQHNTLHAGEDGRVVASGTGETVRLEADFVVNATGYRGEPIAGVPFDERRGVVANREGRVEAEPEAANSREYAAGWIKRGASGVIGSNKQCAAESVRRLVADLQPSSTRSTSRDMAALLSERGVAFVSYDDWCLLDEHERELGDAQGRPRRKEVDVARMLDVIRERRAEKKAPAERKETPKPAAETESTGDAETGTHLSTCTLCEAMCGIRIEYQGDRIIAIAGDEEDPHSRGHICPKGYALQDLHNDPDRLRTPMKRVGEQWLPITWDDAFQEVAERLVSIQAEHGNDAVAGYWGNPTAHNLGIMLTLGSFRSALRSRNVFSASSLDQMPHQLVSYLMFGHNQLFTIPDIDRTDYMLMLGANPAASNGSLMTAGATLERLQGITERGGRIVLVDPRRTETALYASEHQFIQPGTDALFLIGLIQVIADQGLAQPGRLLEMGEGWDGVSAVLNRIPLPRIAELTGIGQEDIERIANEFATARTAICYGRMGVATQEFGALNHWLINLLNILTGNLDRAGGMMFTTPAVDLPASSSRGSFDTYRSRVRGLPEFNREFPASIMAEEMLEPGEGQVRAFISVAGNPVLSAPNGRQLDQALEGLDFMVSVDFYLNETTRHADIILPPTGPLEHERYDLVFNMLAVRNLAKYSEPLFEKPEGSRSDWEIFTELTRRIQRLKQARAPVTKRLKYRANETLGSLLTPYRILDLGLRKGPYGKGLNPLRHVNPFSSGLDMATLKKHPHGMDLGPLRPSLPGRLFTRDRKIHLAPPELLADLERLSQRFDGFDGFYGKAELVLIGRRDLRSNNSWMHNSYRLVKGKDRCALFMHPRDAEARGMANRDEAVLASDRGEVTVTVRVTDDIKPGVVSLPHGWGHHRPGMRLTTAEAHAGVSINDVTDERQVDALSGNAVLNGVPVQVQKAY